MHSVAAPSSGNQSCVEREISSEKIRRTIDTSANYEFKQTRDAIEHLDSEDSLLEKVQRKKRRVSFFIYQDRESQEISSR